MMTQKWLLAAATLWLATVCPLAAQNFQPKWETGVKAAFTGLLSKQGPYIAVIGGHPGTFSGSDANSLVNQGYSIGGYATRFFTPKWSLRGELLFNRLADSQNSLHNSLSLIVAPRYRITPWLDLELAVEARKSISNSPYSSFGSQATLWGGAAVHLGRFEVNLRYAPGYHPSTPFTRAGWTHGMQLGCSTYLFQKKGKS